MDTAQQEQHIDHGPFSFNEVLLAELQALRPGVADLQTATAVGFEPDNPDDKDNRAHRPA